MKSKLSVLMVSVALLGGCHHGVKQELITLDGKSNVSVSAGKEIFVMDNQSESKAVVKAVYTSASNKSCVYLEEGGRACYSNGGWMKSRLKAGK